MGPDHDDDAEFGSPAPEADSPAALVWLFTRTTGILTLCILTVLTCRVAARGGATADPLTACSGPPVETLVARAPPPAWPG
jgi:hypothetical protein